MKYSFKCWRGSPGLTDINGNFATREDTVRKSKIKSCNTKGYNESDESVKEKIMMKTLRCPCILEKVKRLHTHICMRSQRCICRVFCYQTRACSTYSKPNGSHIVVFSSGLRLGAPLTALTQLLVQSWLRTWELAPASKRPCRYNNCTQKLMMTYFYFHGYVSIAFPCLYL